ncbi:uncharacterized protein LOC131854751 [Achroia grisella]|uniref:uncharacterized protein LOC131854751 n=1 Tax=Achroia grisella TaxID=688607 RepID=UPI0027D33995|nr:uncharacterized protein LOC131854751 [Achroia grisella]
MSDSKTNNNNTHSAEYLSSEMMDEDFLSSFAPIRFIQLILGTCRVDSRDRFVTPPTIYQKLYSIVLVVLIVSAFSKIIYTYNLKFHEYQNIYPLPLLLAFCMIATYIINIIHAVDLPGLVVIGTMFIVYTYTIQYLCLQCEFFFREIKVVKSLSITLMSIHQNGPMREKAKKMYKILEETPPSQVMDIVLIINIVCTATVHTIITFFLCFRCELFCKEIKLTKRLSISIMSNYMYGPIREKAKKIYKILEDTPPKLLIYDMWEMNARLLIKFGNIVTRMFVTLLQFTFL